MATSPRWVVLMWAKGPGGQLKMAATVHAEPGPNELAEFRGKISGYYRVMFGDYPEQFDATGKDDATARVATFTY